MCYTVYIENITCFDVKYSVKTIFLNDIVLNGKVKGDGIMKRTFGVVLAILCMFTLSFSGVFASQTPVAKDTVYKIETSVVHGTITPTNAKVAKDSNQTITYSADKGYQLKSVVVDNKAQDIVKYAKSYTFTKVESNHSIAVSYEKPPALAYQRNADKKSMKAGDKVTYTVKVSQTAKDAEARNVVMTDVLPEGLTLDKDSIKGDVKKLEANDNECKVQIDSLKESVVYSYTATASKDIEDGKVLGKMSMKADNLKAYSGTSTTVEQPKADDPKDKEDENTPGGTNQQQGATTPGTDTSSESGQQAQSGDNQSTLTQVEMMKTVSNSAPATGDTVTYTITVKKPQGNVNVKNITVTDQIPEGIEIGFNSIKIVGASGKVRASSSVDSTGANNESKFYVDIAELTENTTITVDAKVVAKSGSVNNVATLSGDGIVKVEDNAAFTVKEATPVETFVVTFVDGQGKTLKTETVEKGKAATAPSDPTREGYTFDGWDKSFDNVTSDLTVTAKWKVEEKKYSLKDKVYVAKNGEYWHYDLNCDGLNHADKDKIDTMTLEQAKKEANRSDKPTTGSKYLVECPDCAKGSTEATGGPYKGDPVDSTKPELKKTADKKEAAMSEVIKYTVTATAKDNEITDVTIKDTLPSGMELVKDSVKASDKGSVSTKDNVITVTYKKLKKQTVTITYEAKATKEGEMKNVATLNYTNKDSKTKASEIKAEATVKISGEAGDGDSDGKVDRAAYKTGDFIPYIVGAVLIALLVAAYVVYRKRNNDGSDE